MGHSYTALYYHVIFSTKDRVPQITGELRTRLCDYIGGIVKSEGGALLAAGGMPDHVHLLVILHASECVADMLRLIKTNSSKWIHETWPDRREFAWQPGYAAFTVSRSSLDKVQAYIEGQVVHHARLSFEDEFVSFLKRHGVSYDEKYLRT